MSRRGFDAVLGKGRRGQDMSPEAKLRRAEAEFATLTKLINQKSANEVGNEDLSKWLSLKLAISMGVEAFE